jgi:glycosyltransferase involved in cell wall biosynthesis
MRMRRRSRVRRRVAIYAPRSSGMYERSPVRVGGAERQMALLALNLANRGVPVAHIVFPPSAPALPRDGAPALIARGPYAGRNGARSKVMEARHVWRALAAADSDVYIVRGGSPALGIAALFCRVRRRRLVFSSAIDGDFTLETLAGRRHRVALYRAGLESASAIVVQSEQQLALARRTLRRMPRLERIPSFGEDPPAATTAAAPEAFIWIGRLIDYKRPLRYLELARAMPDVRFWMVGVDNESQRVAVEVREQAREIPNLELLEPRPHAETMALVERSIAVVSTSRLEGMPNIFLEAWSRGVPVLSLSFDPDGVIEAHGLGTYANDDWQRFRAAAHELARGGGDRAGVAARGPAYVRTTHSPDAVTGRWQALIDDLAA